MQKTLEEEVLAQFWEERTEESFIKWKNDDTIKPIFITISFDMGWNKRSPSTTYDTIADYTVLAGDRFKKLVGLCILSKIEYMW